jgi:hypothetical protein
MTDEKSLLQFCFSLSLFSTAVDVVVLRCTLRLSAAYYIGLQLDGFKIRLCLKAVQGYPTKKCNLRLQGFL